MHEELREAGGEHPEVVALVHQGEEHPEAEALLAAVEVHPEVAVAEASQVDGADSQEAAVSLQEAVAEVEVLLLVNDQHGTVLAFGEDNRHGMTAGWNVSGLCLQKREDRA